MQAFLSLLGGAEGAMMLIGVMGAIITALFYWLFSAKMDAQTAKMDAQYAKLEQALGHIKELLTNHVTDTHKKIDKVEDRIGTVEVKLEDRIDKVEGKIDKVEAKLEAKIDKVEDKIGKVEDKIDKVAANTQNIEKTLVKIAAQKQK